MPIGDSTFIPLNPQLFNDNNELSNFKSYILRQLGWPLIRVEITEEQLMDCILDAVQLYHEYAASDYDVRVISGFAGNQVDIPMDINPKFILDVIFERDYYDTMSAGLGAMGYEETLGGVLPYNISGRSALVQDFDIAGYYLYLQHMEDFKKMLGIRNYFEVIGNKIHLFPATVSYSRVGIIYKPMMNEQKIENEMWVKKYAIAKAKMIVGTIRSKLGGFSSTGTNIAVDGEAMKSEAQAEIDKLEEKLQFLGVPMPIMQM